MAALLGGKMPHVMTSIPGGNMWVPTESKLDDLLAMATETATGSTTPFSPTP